MMYGILFALLALCLACFREGVWTPYTAEDVARWQAEAARAARVAQPFQLAPTPPAASGQRPHPIVRHAPAPQPAVEALELVA